MIRQTMSFFERLKADLSGVDKEKQLQQEAERRRLKEKTEIEGKILEEARRAKQRYQEELARRPEELRKLGAGTLNG